MADRRAQRGFEISIYTFLFPQGGAAFSCPATPAEGYGSACRAAKGSPSLNLENGCASETKTTNNQMANRRQFLSLSTGTAAALISAEALGRGNTLSRHTRQSHALGTQVAITVFHAEQEVAEQAISAALEKIEQVEQVMSLYRPDSQLSTLNRKGVLRHPHPDLVAILRYSEDLSRLTQGAFDVTVQPLWELYSSRTATGALPTTAEIQKVRKRMGWQHLRIESDLIYFDRPGMQVTLNGVAQGMAADLARQALGQYGIEHALIDAGELNAVGSPEDKDHWHIGVQHPRQSGRIAKTGLRNRCLSTSGDYATRFSDDYQHHHILDPRVGLSPSELASVSVAAPTALEADAFSTALLILGLEDAKELVESIDQVDALFVTKTGEAVTTEGFDLI